MARNTTRNGHRTTRAPRLTSRGTLAVAAVAAALVFAAGNGFAAPAAMLGYTLYLLVSGKGSALSHLVPDPRNALRGLCWVAVAVAGLMSLQGATAPGGSTLGLALAVALAVALKLTARDGRRKRRS